MLNISKKMLIGPFDQIVPLDDVPLRGSVKDENIRIIKNGGILLDDDTIIGIGSFYDLSKEAKAQKIVIRELKGKHVAIPGLIDAHTHICFGGNRARDYALRNSGSSYLEIAAAGGGIWDTVTQTRKSSLEELTSGIIERAERLVKNGITTIEVKSGYGLTVDEELKMLRAIKSAQHSLSVDLIPTCLAAHIVPKEFKSNPAGYIELVVNKLFPVLREENLAGRVDAFVEEEAYDATIIKPYFESAKQLGMDITIHADQFHTGGSELAVHYGAISADHLEASTDKEIETLSKSDVIPVALPGASLGLGCPFTPARKLLDAGTSLAIASDYNPGSAPMGDLLTQAAILGSFEKLSNAEVLSGITFRAAAALGKNDRGKLEIGKKANLTIYPTDNYQNILYHQGQLRPNLVLINGKIVHSEN